MPILLSELLPFLPLLIGAGMAAGFLAGLFGIGGGLVVVPALFALLQFKGMAPAAAMSAALATSLASIIPTSIASLRAHQKLANIRWPIVRTWSIPLIAGVLMGSGLIASLRSRYFIIYFALFLVVVAFYSLIKGESRGKNLTLPSPFIQRLLAFILGFLSVIAGVGGGSLGVPLLKTLGATTHQAVGTCSVFGFLVALPSALMLAFWSRPVEPLLAGSWGLIYVPALLVISPLTICFAPLGASLGKKISAAILMRLFAGFLLLVALNMLLAGLKAA